MSTDAPTPPSTGPMPSLGELLSGKHGAPSIQLITGDSADSAKLMDLLKTALGNTKSGVEPMDASEVESLYMKAETPSLWDIVQLRPEFDCGTPTLMLGVDYVVVRVLDRPIYQVNEKSHALTTVDVAVGFKSNHGDHSHYVEVAVDSRSLKVIGNLSSLLNP